MGLAITNLPLLVISVAALALAPVPFLGLALVPWATTLVRMRADLERRMASRAGVLDQPPVPSAPGAGPGRRVAALPVDRDRPGDLARPRLAGARRDRRVRARAGLSGGAAVRARGPDADPAVDLARHRLVRLRRHLVRSTASARGCSALPQGAVILAAGLSAAPWLRRIDARFARLFLAPTKAAELRLRVTQLTVTRADAVDAQAAELRRIERDLHDGAQARLVSLGMMIGLAEELVDRDPAAARKLLAEARAVQRHGAGRAAAPGTRHPPAGARRTRPRRRGPCAGAEPAGADHRSTSTCQGGPTRRSSPRRTSPSPRRWPT